MVTPVRVRIAPSPTGEDLHIGNVYTALLNFAYAKKNNGKFIVRIEDTDRTRYVKGSEERILSSLKWLGLTYDEGPDVSGKFGPYRQSERIDTYKKYAEDLIEKGHAYYCFCTSDRLEEMRKNQVARKEPTLYDGFCKKINPEEAKKKALTEKHVIRLNVPDEGSTQFEDVIRGKVVFENKLIDDQVILKSDGFPTYHLAVVVDDHLMEISHVIRAEDWISSTPKHVLLYTYFGWPLPVFCHVPLIRNPDKSKLSKRKNPVWVNWYKDQGYLPEAILNYLAQMGWSFPGDVEIYSIDQMVSRFDIKDLKAVGPSFDIKKLDWINGEYIRKTENSKLKFHVLEYLNHKYPEQIIEKTIPLIKERIKKISDYLPLCSFFFEKPAAYDMDLSSYKETFKKTANELSTLPNWNTLSIGDAMKRVQEEMKMKPSDYFMVMRVAITGHKVTPPLNESMEILGKEECMLRLSHA